MKKKFVSGFLAMAMLVSMVTTSFAIGLPGHIYDSGDSTEVPVELTVTPLSFSVTVPSVLPITVNGNGEVAVADKVKIVNNSQGKVEVKSLELTTSDGWSLNAMNSDFANMPVNSKVLGMSFNGKDATEGNLAATFAVINANSEQEFTYAAKLAPQSEEILGVNVASAVFTIGWHTENVIPTRKPMFTMVHRPSNTVTEVTSKFNVTLSDIYYYDEEYIDMFNQLGYVYNTFNGGEYFAQIDDRKPITETFINIEYGEQGLISIDRDMLGKTFGELSEYSMIVDWPEGNDLDKTKLDFNISTGIPTVSYIWYHSDGEVEDQSDNLRNIWILDNDTKTFTLATSETLLTENMILYIDGDQILWEAAQK